MSVKITKALHEVMQKCSYVQKTGKNTFHGYKYAGEADLLSVLRPAMIEAGLILLPSVVECRPVDEYGNTTVIMEYTLVHKDGDVWPHPIRIAGTGNDKNKNGIGDKGTYKALTGANKYLLFKLFQIETGDDPEHDERKDDPIAQAKQTAVTEDKHLLVNGDTRSQYAVDKEKNGGKTAYMLNKEKREAILKFVAESIAEHEKMSTKAEIDAWWNHPDRKDKLDFLKAKMPDEYKRLDGAAIAKWDQLDRVPRERNVMQAG